MGNRELLINELSERAGVSKRTIRYYIDEGLLPPPIVRGKYAYFTETYVLRLELIRRLKDNYLPLNQIRLQITSLSDEEVADLLDKEDRQKIQQDEKADTQDERRSSSAVAYIQEVMGRSPSKPPSSRDERHKSSWSTAQPELHYRLDESFRHRAVNEHLAEEWQRIGIIPGVELHVRQPLPPEVAMRLGSIIAWLRKQFGSR